MTQRNKQDRRDKKSVAPKTYIIRKMQPSLPNAIGTIHNGPNVILDFLGSRTSETSREVFASLLLNKRMAKDVIVQLKKYLTYMETYQEEDEDEDEDEDEQAEV